MFNTNAQYYQNISQVLLTSAFILWPTCTRGFGIREKIRCGLRFFGVFLCGFAVFGPPLRPPPWTLRLTINIREIKRQTWIFTTWPSFPLIFRLLFIACIKKISSFMPILTIGIVLDCLYLLIFYSEKFSTWVWRLPQFVVNVNLNLSDTKNIYPEDRSHLLPAVGYFYLTKSRMNNWLVRFYN